MGLSYHYTLFLVAVGSQCPSQGLRLLCTVAVTWRQSRGTLCQMTLLFEAVTRPQVPEAGVWMFQEASLFRWVASQSPNSSCPLSSQHQI